MLTIYPTIADIDSISIRNKHKINASDSSSNCSSDNTIGGVVAVVIALILAITIASIAIVVLRNRSGKPSANDARK